MLLTVTQFFKKLTLLSMLSLMLSTTVANADSAPVRVYSSAALPVHLYRDFQQEVRRSQFEKLVRDPSVRIILRLEDYAIQEKNPFYWARTRMDSREIVFTTQIKLEFWQDSTLVWQESVKKQKNLRWTGPELRGVGQDILELLSQSPEGALSHLPQHAGQERQLRLALIKSVLKQLKQSAIEQLNLEN